MGGFFCPFPVADNCAPAEATARTTSAAIGTRSTSTTRDAGGSSAASGAQSLVLIAVGSAVGAISLIVLVLVVMVVRRNGCKRKLRPDSTVMPMFLNPTYTPREPGALAVMTLAPMNAPGDAATDTDTGSSSNGEAGATSLFKYYQPQDHAAGESYDEPQFNSGATVYSIALDSGDQATYAASGRPVVDGSILYVAQPSSAPSPVHTPTAQFVTDLFFLFFLKKDKKKEKKERERHTGKIQGGKKEELEF